MTTPEERMKILSMIEEGRITAEEGLQLLNTLGSQNTPKEARSQPPQGGPRWMRVQVTELETGKQRVNIRLPVSVINAGMKMGARFNTNLEGMDMNELMEHIQSGETGQIVDVTDEEDGEHVQVFLE